MAHPPRHRPGRAPYGRLRPQIDPPRFTQAPSHPGSGHQDFPIGPGVSPFRARLADIVEGTPDLAQRLVLHIAGDTGGVKDPAPQQIVAQAMEEDAAGDAEEGARVSQAVIRR